jgi:hypothetical protein
VYRTILQAFLSLIWQALQQNPNIATQDPSFGAYAEELSLQLSITELIMVCRRVLAQVKRCIILVEAGRSQHSPGSSNDKVLRTFMRSFQTLYEALTEDSVSVKMLLISCQVGRRLPVRSKQSNVHVVDVGHTLPISRRSRQPLPRLK